MLWCYDMLSWKERKGEGWREERIEEKLVGKRRSREERNEEDSAGKMRGMRNEEGRKGTRGSKGGAELDKDEKR